MTDPRRVSIDERACERTGFCVRVAPGVFALPGGGGVPVVDMAALERDPQAALEAEVVCPTGAISVQP